MEQSEYKDFIDKLTKNYRVIPLFEKEIFEHRIQKNVSLQTNEYLACKWIQYKDKLGKKKIPFDFSHTSDYHFHNYRNCYKPSESITNKSDHQYSLIPGPGVDVYGHIPIPHDTSFRSAVRKAKNKSAILRKTQRKQKHLAKRT